MAKVPLWRTLLATTTKKNPSCPILQQQRSASFSACCWRPTSWTGPIIRNNNRWQGRRSIYHQYCCYTERSSSTSRRYRALVGSCRVAKPAASVVATEPVPSWCLQSSALHDESSSLRQPSFVLLIRRFATDNKNKNYASSSSSSAASPSLRPTVEDDQDQSRKNDATKEQDSTSDTSTAAPKSQPQPPPAFLNNDDYWDHWKEQLRSLPNRITVARILSTPLLSYWIVTQHTAAAVTGCLVAAASDFADGYLARRHRNMATTLGTYLDPLADKILINVLSVSLWITGTLPTALVGLWLVRDLALMTATYRYVQSHTAAGKAVMDPLTTPLQVNPTTISKVNTALQFVTLAVGIVHPAVVELMMSTTTAAAADGSSSSAMVEFLAGPALPAMCWTTGATTILSFASYAFTDHSAFTAVTQTRTSENRNTEKDDVVEDGEKEGQSKG